MSWIILGFVLGYLFGAITSLLIVKKILFSFIPIKLSLWEIFKTKIKNIFR